MASLFDDELERQRKQLAEAGVTPQMIADAPNVAAAESLLPVPLSPIEKMIERDGKGKTFGKMLLGGFTGMTPLLMPELIGGNARYKAELDVYNDQRKRQIQSEQAMPYRDALANNDKSDDFAAIEQLAMLYPDIYGPVLRDMQKNKYAPNPTTYTEGDWEYDRDHPNGEGQSPGRWFVNRQGSDGTMKRDYAEIGFEPQDALPGPEWLQGELGSSQEKLFAHEGNANGARTVIDQMDQIGEQAWTSGIQAKAGEAWKYFTGTEDYVTSVRKNYSDIKVRNAINNLPPGVASDKDIELVMEPWPEGTSDFNFIRRKLEAIAKVEEGRAAYRRFEADYLAKNRKRDGLAKAWAETDHAKRISSEDAPPPTMRWSREPDA